MTETSLVDLLVIFGAAVVLAWLWNRYVSPRTIFALLTGAAFYYVLQLVEHGGLGQNGWMAGVMAFAAFLVWWRDLRGQPPLWQWRWRKRSDDDGAHAGESGGGPPPERGGS